MEFRLFDFGSGLGAGLGSIRPRKRAKRPDRRSAPELRTRNPSLPHLRNSVVWKGRVGLVEERSRRGESIVCFDWTVRDISSMPKGPGAVYYGPELGEFAGSRWHCGIYPKELGTLGEFLGVELWRSGLESDDPDGDTATTRDAHFSLGILRSDGEEDVRLARQMFPKNCCSFSFDRFLSEEELLKWRSDLAPSDILTIRCTLWTDVPSSDECRRSRSLDSSIEKEVSQADHSASDLYLSLKHVFFGKSESEAGIGSCSLDSKLPDIVMCAAREEDVAHIQFVGREYFSSDTLTNSGITRSVIEEKLTPGVPSNLYAPVTGTIKEEEKDFKKHVEWDVEFDLLKIKRHVKGPLFTFGEQSFFLELCLYWRGDAEIQLFRKGPSCSSVYRCWGGLKYADGTYPTNVRNLELDLREERSKWKFVASLGDICQFDLESKYLNSKGCLTAFARLKADGDSSMGDGLTDACVQTDECEIATESTFDGSVQTDGEADGTKNKEELPEDSKSIEKLRQLFKLWLEHPEEGENIRQIRREDFRSSFKKPSSHHSKPDKK